MDEWMNTFLRHFTAFLQRFMPDRLEGAAPEEVRKARLVIAFAAVLESQAILFTGLYFLLGAWQVSAMIACVAITLPTTPLVLRRSTSLATHWLNIQTLAILDSISLYTGGIVAASLFWTAMMPVMATMSASRRVGVAWMFVVGANAAAFAGARLVGVELPTVLTPTSVAVMTSSAIAMLGFVVFAFALVYETTKDEMMAAVERANEDMRRVLDNVGQGFLVVDGHGRLVGKQSAIATAWFGAHGADDRVWEWLGRSDASAAAWLEIGWEAAFEGLLPLELTLAQLPKQLKLGERTMGLEYKPLHDAGALSAIVVVVSDITHEVEADRAEREQREQAALFERLSRDRRGFLLFWDESQNIIEGLRRGEPNAMRLIHTLKGTSGIYGLGSVAAVCHEVESKLVESGGEPEVSDVETIADAWNRATGRVEAILREEREHFEVAIDEYAELESAIGERIEHGRLASMLAAWRYERTAVSFARVADQAKALADRLGKGPLSVVIEDNGVRLDPMRWAPVWSTFVHAVRNAIDHGVEEHDVREARGKRPHATLTLRSRMEKGEVVVEIGDDGQGISWARVAEKARALGLPHTTHDDLVRALFSDGFSTRSEVSETSGRGVGLSALAAGATAVGARIELDSRRGEGTVIRLRAPEDRAPVATSWPATRARSA